MDRRTVYEECKVGIPRKTSRGFLYDKGDVPYGEGVERVPDRGQVTGVRRRGRHRSLPSIPYLIPLKPVLPRRLSDRDESVRGLVKNSPLKPVFRIVLDSWRHRESLG